MGCQYRENLKTLIGHEDTVNSVAFSPDGQMIVSGSWDETIRLWDVNTGKNLETITEYWSSGIYSIAFSPDGQTLASRIADETIRFGMSIQVSKRRYFRDMRMVFLALRFSGWSDARKWKLGQTIRLWNVTSGGLLKTLIGHENSVRSIAFSPDGRTLASGSYDKTIRLWDANTGEPLKTFTGSENLVWSVAFSPDGQTLASGSPDGTIGLWNVTSGDF